MCYPSKGQSTFRLLVHLPLRRSRPVASPAKGLPLGSFPATIDHVAASVECSVFRCSDLFAPLLKLPPFAALASFWLARAHQDSSSVTADSLLDVVAVLSSRLSPAFAGSDLFTTMGSSDTSHHVGHLLIYSWDDVSSFSRFAYGRAHAAWMMPGFPSYCAGSLSVVHVSKHLLQLFLYRASRLFARSPLRPAESSSLTLRSL